jgi:hypothetical protein
VGIVLAVAAIVSIYMTTIVAQNNNNKSSSSDQSQSRSQSQASSTTQQQASSTNKTLSKSPNSNSSNNTSENDSSTMSTNTITIPEGAQSPDNGNLSNKAAAKEEAKCITSASGFTYKTRATALAVLPKFSDSYNTTLGIESNHNDDWH